MERIENRRVFIYRTHPELDEGLSRLAIVKATHLGHLVPMHAAKYVAVRERLRIRHLHLIATPLPRSRHSAALSRSPDSGGTA